MLQFLWDSGNIEHIARHGVTTDEAEQVVLNHPVALGTELKLGEERRTQIGETDERRVLIVVTTWRECKLRVVTAWQAKSRMRTIYELRKQADPAGRAEEADVPDGS